MVNHAVRQDESVAGGARWVTVAFVVVGALNYGYALVMTHFLGVGQYSSFAAGQGLLLWATTVATVSVPWVLAQALARARSGQQRYAAVRVAKVISAGSGVAGAIIVGGITTRFADLPASLTLAAGTFVIFLGTTTAGWLQGNERMRVLSALYVGENVLKNASGLLLVIVAGLGDAGALAGFAIGGLLLVVWWPRVPRVSGRAWLAAVGNRQLWHRAAGIAGLQGLVALFTAIDVVLVTLLPVSRPEAASYQASAALSRVPVFVASAVATAFFPALSRRASAGGALAAGAVRMYATMALPVTAVLVTVPAPVLAVAFPSAYGAMAELVRYTAVGGLAVGGISLFTAFFQAADDYACLWWLSGGLAAFVAALAAGWAIGGIIGLAEGGAAGTAAVLVLLGYRLVRREGRAVLGRIPLAAPAAAVVLLFVLRPWPVAWLVAAGLVGLLVLARFLGRPAFSQRPARTPHPHGGEIMHITRDQPAAKLLADALWHGEERDPTGPELARATALARRNHVEGWLARAFPQLLPAVQAEVRVAGDLFVRNLEQVTGLLRTAGIPSVLIKAEPAGATAANDFDLVVRATQWQAAAAALHGWYIHSARYWLERSSKALFFPPVGPALHLHAGVSWFGVPVMSTGRLLSRARRGEHGCLVPAPADELLILLAHALFQELALPLSALLAARERLAPPVVAAAREEASAEGWQSAFDGIMESVRTAIGRLDRGLAVPLPVALPVALSLRAGAEHARALRLRGETGAAARELALRLPLVAAKKRRMLIA